MQNGAGKRYTVVTQSADCCTAHTKRCNHARTMQRNSRLRSDLVAVVCADLAGCPYERDAEPWSAETPVARDDRPRLWWEIAIVLGLSLGASADLLHRQHHRPGSPQSTPLADQTAPVNPSQSAARVARLHLPVPRQPLPAVRRRAGDLPALAARERSGFRRIGFDLTRPGARPRRRRAALPRRSAFPGILLLRRRPGRSASPCTVQASPLDSALVDGADPHPRRPARGAAGGGDRRRLPLHPAAAAGLGQAGRSSWRRRCCAAATTSTRASGRSSATRSWASSSAGATPAGAA